MLNKDPEKRPSINQIVNSEFFKIQLDALFAKNFLSRESYIVLDQDIPKKMQIR